jgi:hypothetical protein
MNDFETVRRSILTTLKVDGDVEALDRIEAEVERLRENAEGRWEGHIRLQEKFAAAEVEVERLRAELALRPDGPSVSSVVHGKQMQLEAVQAEVERLRAHDAQMTSQVVNLKAEVERLQRQLDNLLDERGETPYVAEVERQREELERLRNLAEVEVERLAIARAALAKEKVL